MAEIATNMVCKKLNIDKKCETATTPLPGAETTPIKTPKHNVYAFNAQVGRHGTNAVKVDSQSAIDNALVCECEEVTVGEIKYVVNNQHVNTLTQLRRRTRVGMGTCQGELCALRAAGVLCGACKKSIADSAADLADFMNERWKGMYPVGWGSTLNEAQLMSNIYQGLCGLDNFSK